MNENTALAVTFIVISIVFSAAALGGCHEVESTKRAAMKVGLVFKDGSWQKP